MDIKIQIHKPKCTLFGFKFKNIEMRNICVHFSVFLGRFYKCPFMGNAKNCKSAFRKSDSATNEKIIVQ